MRNSDLKAKLATLATKAELKAEQVEIVKIYAFDSIYFCCKSHFEDYGTQNVLVFQPVSRYYYRVVNTSEVTATKSIGLSYESINKPLSTSDNNLSPKINYFDFFDNSRILVKFDGSCLKHEKLPFTYQKSSENLSCL